MFSLHKNHHNVQRLSQAALALERVIAFVHRLHILRNVIAFMVVALTLTGCAIPLESVYIPGDASSWKVGYSSDRRDHTIVEYVPTDESIDHWSRLLTMQFLEEAHGSPMAVMHDLKDRLARRCPSLQWHVIRRDATSVLYEWSTPKCGAYPAQHEVARLLKGNDGMHRIAFDEKGTTIKTTDREKWIKALSSAYVVKDGKRVVVKSDRQTIMPDDKYALIVGWGNTFGEVTKSIFFTVPLGIRVDSLYVTKVNGRNIPSGTDIVKLPPGRYDLSIYCDLRVGGESFSDQEIVDMKLDAKHVYQLMAHPRGDKCFPSVVSRQ